MFRRDRIRRRGGGVILYITESIQAYEIKLEREACCDKPVWCNIVIGTSKLTIGLLYRSPNIWRRFKKNSVYGSADHILGNNKN